MYGSSKNVGESRALFGGRAEKPPDNKELGVTKNLG
jgi:hypothetical protein